MVDLVKTMVVILMGFLLASCASNKTYTIQLNQPSKYSKNIKQVALFLDGTGNTMGSRTNVSTLNQIVKNQDRDNLYLFYNEGVGTNGRVVGAATGWGIEKDVAEAYAFLTEYYSPDSKLYVFGFSRGAYTSRILAGMIYSVGIYSLSSLEMKDRVNVAKELYSVYM